MNRVNENARESVCRAWGTRSRYALLFALIVNLATMCDTCYVDSPGAIVDLVNNSVLSNANPPFLNAAFEFLAAGRAWVPCQIPDA